MVIYASQLFEVRIHIFIITLPQTSEELLIKLLVLLSPEAPNYLTIIFLLKALPDATLETQLLKQQNFTLYIQFYPLWSSGMAFF